MSIPTLRAFTFSAADTLSVSLRAIIRDGAPWFIALDVACALGYSDAFEMTKRLEDDQKQNLQLAGFGNRGVVIISESGLYEAVFGSRKPEAKAFRKWVTSVVLPSIRREGAYVKGAEHLPAATQANLYAIVREAAREALRRYDRVTEHDHWTSEKNRQARAKAAISKVAQEMGLPVSVVAAAATSGLEVALASLG